MWFVIAILLTIVVIILLYILYGKRAEAKYLKEKVEDLEKKLEQNVPGIATELSALDAGLYSKVSEIIHPEEDEKIVAILPIPNDDYEMVFVRVDPETVVPKKFEIKSGKMFFIEEEGKKT